MIQKNQGWVEVEKYSGASPQVTAFSSENIA